MKLREIISISGKPGLYRIVNFDKMPYTVEDISNGRRMPIFGRDKVSSLAEIAMYTEEGDLPLGQVFQNIHEAYGDTIPEEKEIIKDHETLRTFMNKVLPTYDEERVHDSDIRKLVKWYILLRQQGMVLFVEDESDSNE